MTSTWFVPLSLVCTSRFVPLHVCDHSQGVYFPPKRRRSMGFRVLSQRTNKQKNKLTNKQRLDHLGLRLLELAAQSLIESPGTLLSNISARSRMLQSHCHNRTKQHTHTARKVTLFCSRGVKRYIQINEESKRSRGQRLHRYVILFLFLCMGW